mgnify:CR=1 FL=1
MAYQEYMQLNFLDFYLNNHQGYKYFALQHGNGRTGWCSCDNDWNHVTKYGAKSCGKTGNAWGNYVYQNKGVR